MRRRALLSSAALGGLALVLTACGSGGAAATNQQRFVSQDGQTTRYPKGERPQAPAMKGEDVAGSPLDAASHAGKVLVINFWASWCPPCRLEGPELVTVAAAVPEAQFLGINIRDERDKAEAFEKGLGVTYPSFWDPSGRIALGFEDVPPTTIPATIIIDREGGVAAIFRKGLIGSELQPVLAEIVAET
ncbi:hypothetical protein Afil01_19280 [Actinorhabdospora filicis]|uniref:Thioredoxin domain-containing protein n=1 Tax=Actinorhabdospora filicis TaxID=1785913 RepID=A0A9W6W941_9ACTN|nr:TlpA disulfide reductase family protein [Actinorhabdospora filicis]GLZ77121.1 hypothetical protein Afil01_19280 [Actinorhabdospora filicis]